MSDWRGEGLGAGEGVQGRACLYVGPGLKNGHSIDYNRLDKVDR